MQKKLIALAVASIVSAPAFADNVQIYGVIDQAITSGKYSANNGTVTSLNPGGYTTERLGFQGSEDLGNGLKANFRLETGLDSSNGFHDQGGSGWLFQREARVGVSSKSWGSVDFGRQYTPIFKVQAANDLFRVAGVGSVYAQSSTGMTRASNSIVYSSNTYNGFSMMAMYSMGANAAQQESQTAPKDLGKHAGFNLRYANGPLSLDYGYGNQKYSVVDTVNGAASTEASRVKAQAVNGSYDFKIVKLQAGYIWVDNNANPVLAADTAKLDANAWDIGVVIPVFGKDQIKVQYTDYHNKLVNSADANLWSLGYVHPMSKRTTLYATWAKITNENAAKFNLNGSGGTANAGFDPSALQFGLSHNF